MTVSRRTFLRKAVTGSATVATAACAAAVAPSQADAFVRPPKELPPDAVGLLYDSTLCIGCKACVAACKESNGMPLDISDSQSAWNPGIWDTPVELSAKTLNVIKVYTHGTMDRKDHAENGFAFLKRQCYHCVDPSCVSVCPVSAMTKDPRNGIVSYDADACIGCRYCVLSCPFGVPKYDYDNAFGEIHKCQLCKHKLAEDKLPGCVDVCPTGATVYGRTEDLRAEAHRRQALKPGDVTHFPRGDISGDVGGARPGHDATIQVAYQPTVYGETELGGTQSLTLASVPYEKLNLPVNMPKDGFPTLSEGIQHTLYAGLVGPAVVFAGLAYLARRSAKDHAEE